MHWFEKSRLLAMVALTLGLGQAVAFGSSSGTATNITGLDYTGTDTSGALAAGGTQDQTWYVTYANVNGTNYTGNSQYTGAAYVIDNSYIAGESYIQNSNSSEWITAPGAGTSTSGTSTNSGGDYLPGDGVTSATYSYTLTFSIIGSGGNGKQIQSQSNGGSNIQISLTIAADDNYYIYMNPTLNSNGSVNTGSSLAGPTGLASWTNSTTVYLQNYATGSLSSNANFYVGTNTLSIVVENTNQGLTGINPSGVLLYEVSEATINGHPVPEVSTWLLLVGALGLYQVEAMRRRKQTRSALA